MKTMNRSSVIFLGVKCAFSLFVLFIMNVIIHEGAHYFTALVLGIPIAHFTLFDPTYFAPVFVSASKDYTTGMTIVSYAGGLVPGVLLLGAAFVAVKIGAVNFGLGLIGLSPYVAAAIIVLTPLLILLGKIKEQFEQAKQWEALIPPGMREIEPSMENRDRGVFPSGTRQFESIPGNPYNVQLSDWYNFGQNQTSIRNMTMDWVDQI